MTVDNNLDEFASPVPEKKKRPIWIWVAVGVGLLLICCIVSIVSFGGALFAASNESEEATLVVDQFMTAMEAEDYGQAYRLFSPDARNQFPLDDLFAMGNGQNRVLFENYASVNMVGFDINSDIAIGTLVDVNGTISYSSGREGTFEAQLVKEDGFWMLMNINVEIPPVN